MKIAGFAAFALVLTAAGAAEAQTVVSRQVKSQPVETVVTRQTNGTLTTSRRVMVSSPAAMRVAKPSSMKPRTKIVYRTIVREVPVEPQMIMVREPRTTLVPSILPPFLFPVTTYEDRAVYTTPSYTRPAYQVMDDEDASPLVRAYAPASYVVRY